jgi:lipid II:glycine glycyltransferase (peptidoglycan interpeptide bridge formation enzyme)
MKSQRLKEGEYILSVFKIIECQGLWNNILKDFENADSYYSYGYGQLFAEKENGQLKAAYFENEVTKIFYPFIEREIKNERNHGLFDLVTPYGYGGPLLKGENSLINDFYRHFNQYCVDNNIVSEVIRFHPLYRNHQICTKNMEVEYIRKTTAVDLSRPLEEIRESYSSLTKRNIIKAQRNNLSCIVADKNPENIQEFFKMYTETMDRNSADEYYYFDVKQLMNQLTDTHQSNSYLLLAKSNNRTIAGVILFIGPEYAHYHLGGSYTEYLKLRPNNILFDYMIEFSKKQGVKQLHLGGGYQEGDGLFNFKSSFTNSNHFGYYIGKKIHNHIEYNNLLKNQNLDSSKDNYFPLYRSKKVGEKEISKEVIPVGK